MALNSSLYRSLGENKELIPTWINPNGDAVAVEISYDSRSSDPIMITGSLSQFRSTYHYSESIIPQIVSQWVKAS